MSFGKIDLIFDCQDFTEQEKKEFDTAPIYDEYEEQDQEKSFPIYDFEALHKAYLVEQQQLKKTVPKPIKEIEKNKPCTKAIEGNHGVIYSMLIKEKKPDSLQTFPIQDGTVSRTKLFEEGEYDMIMEPPEKNHVTCSAQTKAVINSNRKTTTLTTFSPQLEHSSKLNQSIPSSGEEVIQLPRQVNPSRRESDIRAFKEFSQPNQKESSYKINCSGILIHQSNYENRNQPNWSSYVQEMDFSSLRICFSTQCASMPKIESHSPTQVRSSYESTWRMFINLLCFQQDQDHKKWTSDHKDSSHLPKWVELVLCLKNARPTWFRSLQTFVWDPGYISKPNKEFKFVPQEEQTRGRAKSHISIFKTKFNVRSFSRRVIVPLSFMQVFVFSLYFPCNP